MSAPPDENAQPPVLPTKSKVSEVLDSVSKATVAGLLVIYVCGFVIVSINNAEYGFTEFNPWRPKILGAGALFGFLTALPMMTAHAFFPTDEIPDAQQRYARNLVAATNYMLKCNGLALSLVLIYAASVASVGTTKFWNWWEVIFIFVVTISLFYFKEWGAKTYRTHPRRILLIGSALLLVFIVWVFAVNKTNNRFVVELETWLFGVGLLVAIDRWVFWKQGGRRLSQWSAYNWSAVLLLMIPMLFYFARVIYPLIRPSWGGGSSTRVIVYFSHDSRILPNQQFEGDLIDESDNGIYIVKRNEKQAIFIPRQSVSALYFADKPLAPEFLKGVP